MVSSDAPSRVKNAQRWSPPRAAYLHLPFCEHRCGYCNFAIVAGRPDLIRPVLAAIHTELQALGGSQEIDTLYFGGGTPSQLTAEELGRLCESTRATFRLASDYEWTVEVNPGDVDRGRMQALAEAGITRVSLGAQSFRSAKLAALDRRHSPRDVFEAFDLARSTGMAVAIDLMFAAPDEALADWHDDLQQAIRLRPDHISTYGLTIEKGTAFWARRRRGELVEAPDDLQRLMYLAAIDELAAGGFEHYEVSNFAQPGRRSRHNETYWAGREYFAAGPGAARYVAQVRETNHRSTTTYLRRMAAGESPVAEREALNAEQRARERLILGLRTIAGIDRVAFAEETEFDVDALAGETLARFAEQGLLDDDGRRVRLTRAGLLVSDCLWPELL